MKRSIYADNAATTKLDIDAFEAMKPYLLEEYGNASQPYAFARKPKKALAEARTVIADCIGALPKEIYFTSGGTESDNWALKGAVQSKKKHLIITSQIEHHAVLNTCSTLECFGYPIVYLPVNTDGIVTTKVLAEAITQQTRLVSVMLVNNEVGTIEPIKALAAVAHAQGVLFHTDAVQAVGHIPIDVKDLKVDMLSASAHKFNGPKGTGFLYVRKGIQLQPFMDGGAQESRQRAGTENVASIVGMAVALKKNCDEMQKITKKLHAMENIFLDMLRQSDVDFIRNGGECRVPGNINISIRGASGEMLLHRLDLQGISVSTGSACDSVETQVSHVICAMGVPSEYAEGTIRISFGRDNTEEDAVDVAKTIINVLARG